MTPRRALTWLCLLALGLAGVSAARFTVTTDITHFLPSGDSGLAARVSKALSSSTLAQRMILTLGGAEPEVLARNSLALAERLRGQRRDFSRVQAGVDPDAERRIFDLYFPHRHQLYSAAPDQELGRALSEPGLRAAAERLVADLSSLEGQLVRRIAPADPLLAFPRILSRLERAQRGGLTLAHGAFFSRDGRVAVTFLQTRASAFDTQAQRRALAVIRREFAELRRAEAGLWLEMTGVNRHAIHAETAIRADVARVSLVSLGAIAVLFAGLFRSLRALALVATPPLFGILAASAATLAVFGSLHGLTLAFGATLVGVCVDYPVHLLCHHRLGAPERAGPRTLATIWPAILLGGLTTLAGLGGLGLSSFPGIREMAWFTAVGVVSALAVTRYLLPPLVGAAGGASAAERRLAGWFSRAAAQLSARRWLSYGVLLAAALLAIASLPRLRFEDDISRWAPAPRALRAEDERVRSRVTGADPGRFVVATAAGGQGALAQNDAVARLLEEAEAAGEIGGFRSLHAMLFSEPLQRDNQRAFARALEGRDSFERAFDEAGFTEGAFEPFFHDLARPPAPLALAGLRDSALGPAADAFVLELDGEPAFSSYLNEVRDPEGLRRRLAGREGILYFDQASFLHETYAGFRTRTLELIALGLCLVFAMVLVRYRSLRLALAAALPAVLAAACSLALLALAGVAIDLFHVAGLLLVLSIGVDYGVFLVESREDSELSASLLGIAIACGSTFCSFGLLALSEIPALRSLGQVIGAGVTLSLLFSPAALSLAGERAR